MMYGRQKMVNESSLMDDANVGVLLLLLCCAR